MTREQYIKQSLEMHLVFLRLMKEHALIIGASLPQKNQNLIKETKAYNSRYNSLLSEVVIMATDVIPISDGAITNMTLPIEEKTQELLGYPIDMELTKKELTFPKPKRLSKLPNEESISAINKKIVDLTEQYVLFKTRVYNAVIECSLFSSSYPELLHHIRWEALVYINKINAVENRKSETLSNEDILGWNHIMIEHAEFIRGLLDPSEEELFKVANGFVEKGKKITLGPNLLNQSIDFVEEIRDFKEQAIKIILECNLKSIIIPIVSDHVLREANYYLSLLKMQNE